QVLKLLADEHLDVAGDFLVEECLADALDDGSGRGRAHVCEVEALLQLAEEVFIDAPLEPEKRGHAAEDVARLGQALLDLVEDRPEHQAHLAICCRRVRHSSEVNEQAPSSRPGPWQSLPAVIARPSSAAHARSCRIHLFLNVGYSASTAWSPQSRNWTRRS